MDKAINVLTPEQRQAIMIRAQQEANQQVMQEMLEKMVASCFGKCAGTSVSKYCDISCCIIHNYILYVYVYIYILFVVPYSYHVFF
jgi:hypothetical protein